MAVASAFEVPVVGPLPRPGPGPGRILLLFSVDDRPRVETPAVGVAIDARRAEAEAEADAEPLAGGRGDFGPPAPTGPATLLRRCADRVAEADAEAAAADGVEPDPCFGDGIDAPFASVVMSEAGLLKATASSAASMSATTSGLPPSFDLLRFLSFLSFFDLADASSPST